MAAMKEQKIHLGRNIKRIREILGIKQEALALELGEDWSQKKISLVETKEEIEPAVLTQIADALDIHPEGIRYFNEQSVIQFVRINFSDQSTKEPGPLSKLESCIFSKLLDKIVELYERMLSDKSEMIQCLNKMIDMNETATTRKDLSKNDSADIKAHKVSEPEIEYRAFHGFHQLN